MLNHKIIYKSNKGGISVSVTYFENNLPGVPDYFVSVNGDIVGKFANKDDAYMCAKSYEPVANIDFVLTEVDKITSMLRKGLITPEDFCTLVEKIRNNMY